jgi:hypothetical protein
MYSRLATMVLAAAVLAAPDPAAVKIQGPDTIGTPLPVAVFPPGATGLTQTYVSQSSAVAAGGNSNTLPATAGKITYCTGFTVTGGGATGASNIAVTLTQTASNNLNYVIVVPAGATTSITPLVVTFNPPVPASAPNTGIILTVPSFGAGNTNAAAEIHGFQQ